MPIPTFTRLGPQPEFGDLVKKINTLVGELTNLMLNLDSLNVLSLTADHITAGTINTGDITIGADNTGKFYRIDGDGIVANNGSVNTLLFDLATGLMTLTSVLVQSASGTYPKVVMDPDNELFGAYAAADKSIVMAAFLAGYPYMDFVDGAVSATLSYTAGSGFQILNAGDIELKASLGDINMVTPTGQTIFSDWDSVYSNGDIENLQQALDAKASATSATSANGGHNHGIPNGAQLLGADGVTVYTFSSAADHAHNQT